MAKKIDQLRRNWLSHRLDNLTAKIAFFQDYLLVNNDKLKQQTETVLKEEQERRLSELGKLAFRLGVEDPVLSETKEKEAKILNDKFYWRFRVLKQTVKRRTARSSANSENIEKWANVKHSALVNSQAKALEKIEKKYEVTNGSEALMKYQKAQAESASEFEQFSKDWRIFQAKRQADFEAKTKQTIERLQKQQVQVTKDFESIAPVTDGNIGQLSEGTILRLDGLSMHFGGLKAVDNLSFEVKKGEIFGLIGPNGAGKTTVFNCITQFYKPTLGNIYYRNRKNEIINMNDFKTHEVIREGIVRTFQNVELIWEISVLDNLLVSGHTIYKTGFFSHLINSVRLRQEELVIRKKALWVLEKLDLTAYQNMIPYGLPYGILKKIELARTLMVNPRLIILDEPAAGLNEEETKNLAEIIRKIRTQFDATIFLVEHDMSLVMNLCDTICAISFGKKLAIGTPSEIQNDKNVIEAYLGGD